MLLTTILKSAAILLAIREKFDEPDKNLDAYIVPQSGQHYGYGLAPCERRIAAVSGFTGSSGSVIITRDAALLWTDGRYFIQAEAELDPAYWTLMREGDPGVPTEAEWLVGNLTGDARVGVDATLYPKSSWDKMSAALTTAGFALVAIDENLVDIVPETEMPPCTTNPIEAFSVEFAGRSVAEKLEDVKEKMREEKADLLLVSELDEIAWLFNLRGSDIPPMFYAYAAVGLELNNVTLIVNAEVDTSGIEADLTSAGVTIVQNYTGADEVFKNIVNADSVTHVWVSKYVNAQMALMADNSRGDPVTIKRSPLALLKAIKNPTEVAGMRAAHLRDSAAITAFIHWLDGRIVHENATDITELTAAEKLLSFRRMDTTYFVNQSFTTISAFGPNAAIVHYRPAEETAAVIQKEGVYLVDSGGQYLDGTTDITRTVYLGNATKRPDVQDRFTRVLKGHIAVAQSIFPNKATGHRLDSFARKFLWDVKLDYAHGSGHGIGHYMNVHEGPQSMGSTPAEDDSGLEADMFMSNEPGYYLQDDYGVRIENIVRVGKVEDAPGEFLELETVSFVPIEMDLIDFQMLTPEEISWLDAYHLQCREKVGNYIKEVGNFENEEALLAWLNEATETVEQYLGAGSKMLFSSMTLAIFLIIQHLLTKFIL